MVKLQVTNNMGDEYIVEVKVSDSADEVCAKVARIHNLRNRVRRLAAGLHELALYGPMKPIEERGLTDEQLAAVAKGRAPTAATCSDPSGLRVGAPPSQQLAETLDRVADAAERLVSSALSLQARAGIDEAKVGEALQECRGAVMMAFPMGLPEWDSVREALDDAEELAGTQHAKDVFDPAGAVLWFAGKKIARGSDAALSKFVGTNEKMLVKVKLTSERAAQPPQREPAVDAETQQKMIAMWHKKQEEDKRLAEADEDSYLNSEWANPRGFKQAAQGLGNINFRF